MPMRRRRTSRGSLDALREPRLQGADTPYMYWGLMETYKWSLTVHRPMRFQYKFGSLQAACAVENVLNHTVVSPIHFAKGPMFFISAPLVAQVAADPMVRSYTMTVIASTDSSTMRRVLPWEDVYTGLLLLRSVASVNATYVHMGSYVAG